MLKYIVRFFPSDSISFILEQSTVNPSFASFINIKASDRSEERSSYRGIIKTAGVAKSISFGYRAWRGCKCSFSSILDRSIKIQQLIESYNQQLTASVIFRANNTVTKRKIFVSPEKCCSTSSHSFYRSQIDHGSYREAEESFR